MSFFQLNSDPAPGTAWPSLRYPIHAQIWMAYLDLCRTQWLAPEEIERIQQQRIRELVQHCMQQVPYYQKMYREAGIRADDIQSPEDFRNVPLLPRRIYQENLPQMQAEQLPPGHVATNSHTTSGSSGTPTRVFQTNVVNVWWFAFVLRDMEWCGIDPTGSLVALRSTGAKGDELAPAMRGERREVWMKSLQPLIRQGPAHLMDITQDPRVQFEFLIEANPDYLVSYPANLEVLAEMMRGREKLSNLKVIQAISDTLHDDVRQRIEESFGVAVKNDYSSMEMGYIASPCPEADQLHLHAENVYLEVLDENHQPCSADETGDAYVTSLHNFRAPFVRYELGDKVTMADKPCSCGRGLPVIQKVHGKDSPMFYMPDGSRRSTTRLAFLLRKKAGPHWQHQVAQKSPNRIVVRIVPAPNWNGEHTTKAKEVVAAFFENAMRVDVELHERLETPKSGKFQNMVIEMEE